MPRSLPIRYGEEKKVKILARTQPHQLPDAAYDAHAKTLVLLQCHFSRKMVPADLRADQKLLRTHIFSGLERFS